MWTVQAVSNLDMEEAWVPMSNELDEVPFNGTDVIFEIHSETDPMGVTSFWVDDLRLDAACER